MEIAHQNADRFSKFADFYDQVRPALPLEVRSILLQYLGHQPSVLVDIGCGTGLSTAGWSGYAANIIGVEPSDAMLSIAQNRTASDSSIRYIHAFSDQTGLPDDSADLVTCSQSFHWMDPDKTIPEIARVLKTGGIFSAFDCDWPPVCHWEAEKAYEELFDVLHRMHAENHKTKDRYKHWDKNKHLENLKKSGKFRYVREVLFSQTEETDAERFIGLAWSQGDLQSLLEAGVEEAQSFYDTFEKKVRQAMGTKRYPIRFGYRMRLAVK
ncbi:MAG: class I SAM-dependent methyltransferase [Ethanoligenens sp.]|uniref:class I SAM-dependent methyltransferase n=1 Tax=Ethanoligenens sp. TaxID=2099655 RepID=UPI0039E94CAB